MPRKYKKFLIPGQPPQAFFSIFITHPCLQKAGLITHHLLPLCAQQNLYHYLLINIIVFSKIQVYSELKFPKKAFPFLWSVSHELILFARNFSKSQGAIGKSPFFKGGSTQVPELIEKLRLLLITH